MVLVIVYIPFIKKEIRLTFYWDIGKMIEEPMIHQLQRPQSNKAFGHRFSRIHTDFSQKTKASPFG